MDVEPAIVGELRRCALRAGLIHDEHSTALDFCSEPEASALECVRSPELSSPWLKDPYSSVLCGDSATTRAWRHIFGHRCGRRYGGMLPEASHRPHCQADITGIGFHYLPSSDHHPIVHYERSRRGCCPMLVLVSDNGDLRR